MVEPVLTVNDLQIEFRGKAGRQQAVCGVSFELKPSRVLGIVGESGSGKSATCLSILGLLGKEAQVSGRIQLSGQDLMQLQPEEMRRIRGKEISIIMQNPISFFDSISTIGKHFMKTLRSHQSITQADAQQIAIEQLSAVGLRDAKALLKQFPFQLSGGMLQRVMIAIALSLKPKILIADEPTTALDVLTQVQLLKLIARLQKQHDMAILLVTHDLGVIAQLADDVAVMYAGQFVEQATVATLFDHPQHPYTRSLLESRPNVRISR
ncbi:ABC transporter ATP-binding protein [Oculatella sp. LEGE 06141]|uniref:ABC transporter ATP-binding protein n=1 Tax=Oculatella sp. LEGE 06141 TaxID=1828648 RepID=UPI001881E0BD|nr:ABC transporter ATP-binding protein [Oculatella sp. LEGE 06141]MBE9178141.1 ABC transporter ATP-binding protein [Oculatella sp. LEGE 06141]